MDKIYNIELQLNYNDKINILSYNGDNKKLLYIKIKILLEKLNIAANNKSET